MEHGDKLENYRDKRGKWRWRMKDPQGRIIAASTQGYVNKKDMLANRERVTGRSIMARQEWLNKTHGIDGWECPENYLVEFTHIQCLTTDDGETVAYIVGLDKAKLAANTDRILAALAKADNTP